MQFLILLIYSCLVTKWFSSIHKIFYYTIDFDIYVFYIRFFSTAVINCYFYFSFFTKALTRLGLTEAERMEIYTMVAAVLHLGNITFEDNPEDTKGGSRISSNSEKAVLMSAKLLAVDPEELRQALVSKVMQTSRGGIKGTVIM